MSFTQDVKKELTGLEIGRKCCQLAEITGFLRFAGSIMLQHGKMGLRVVTDNPAVARLFVTLVRDYFGAKTALSVEDGQMLRKGRSYNLTITPEMNAEAILRETGAIGIKEGSNYLRDGIDSGIIKKRCCKKSALRGVFMAAGSVSDPAKAYHLEISCASMIMASDVRKLINSFGLNSKIVERRGKYIVYIKDAEQISDFLRILECSNQLAKYENIRISKEMKNTANRINNCESANADKTVNAAQKLIADIALIEEKQGLDYLPEKLREAAVLRKENPELPLSELAQLFDPPLGKSGLNHRLSKISQVADSFRK